MLRESVTLMSGQPKLTEKTWLALLMGLAASSGKEMGCFKAIEPVPVAFFEGEGASAPFAQRFRALQRGYDLPDEQFGAFFVQYMSGLLLDNAAQVREIVAKCKDGGVKLAVLDTFAKHNAIRNENDAAEVSRALRGLDQFRMAGISTLMLTHTRKANKDDDGTEDIDQDLRGSTALSGFLDFHFGLRRASARQKYTKLTIRAKDAEEKYFRLLWNIEQDETKRPSSARLEMVETKPGEVDEGLLDAAAGQLEPNVAYTKTALVRLWSAEKEDVEIMIEQLLADGTLGYKNRKFFLANRPGDEGVGQDDG